MIKCFFLIRKRDRKEKKMIVVKKQPYQMKNTAVCIGKFDGLHMGHQSLIAEISKYTQYQKVLFTFAFPEGPYILTPE